MFPNICSLYMRMTLIVYPCLAICVSQNQLCTCVFEITQINSQFKSVSAKKSFSVNAFTTFKKNLSQILKYLSYSKMYSDETILN